LRRKRGRLGRRCLNGEGGKNLQGVNDGGARLTTGDMILSEKRKIKWGKKVERKKTRGRWVRSKIIRHLKHFKKKRKQEKGKGGGRKNEGASRCTRQKGLQIRSQLTLGLRGRGEHGGKRGGEEEKEGS